MTEYEDSKPTIFPGNSCRIPVTFQLFLRKVGYYRANCALLV